MFAHILKETFLPIKKKLADKSQYYQNKKQHEKKLRLDFVLYR